MAKALAAQKQAAMPAVTASKNTAPPWVAHRSPAAKASAAMAPATISVAHPGRADDVDGDGAGLCIAALWAAIGAASIPAGRVPP